ncbi:hypothetical protein HBI80_124190 [Parastagonospora nodorum]|nr:hypothetical protein HBI80_124190 [Parastagonospora nodorum]
MVQPLARLEDCRAGVCTPFDSPCLAPVKFIQYPCDIPAYRGLGMWTTNLSSPKSKLCRAWGRLWRLQLGVGGGKTVRRRIRRRASQGVHQSN